VCSQIDASRKFSLSAPPLPAAPLSTS
jgi:hypothetical protein